MKPEKDIAEAKIEPKTSLSDRPSSPTGRRQSRYNRIQERRAAQKRADNRFYAGMFSMMGVLTMLAILLAAIVSNGGNVDVRAMESWSQPWLGPLTKLEAAGLVFVAFIAAMAYMRMRKK